MRFSCLLCRFGQCQPPQRQPHNHLSWQWKNTAIPQQHFSAFPHQAAECDSTACWARFSVHYHFHSRWAHSFRAAGRKTNLLCIYTQPGPGEWWSLAQGRLQHGQPCPPVIQMENSSGWALGETLRLLHSLRRSGFPQRRCGHHLRRLGTQFGG